MPDPFNSNPFDYPPLVRVYRASLRTDPYRAVEVFTPIEDHTKASIRSVHWERGEWTADGTFPTTIERHTAAGILRVYHQQAADGLVTLTRYEI